MVVNAVSFLCHLDVGDWASLAISKEMVSFAV